MTDLSPATLDALAKLIAVYSRRAVSTPLSPMEEMGWFQTPKFQYISLSAAGGIKHILNPASYRVGVIFDCGNATGCQVSNDSGMDTTARPGMFVSTTKPVLMLRQSEWGALVQGDWYAGTTSAGGIILTYMELLLRDWPRGEE